MPAFFQDRQAAGKINTTLVTGLLAAAVAIVAAAYFLWPKPDPEPLPVPARSVPLEIVAAAETAQERGDSGRETIEKLRADPAGVDYALAYEKAQEFRTAGNLADAQLLFFFAARGGHPPAQFELATLYDPNHFAASGSLMERPDPAQAYKWYRGARDAGDDAALQRLEQLRTWTETAAAAGDQQAERLLLLWE